MQVLPAASQGSMLGKEGWSMLPCRRRLMRFDWPRGTCCPRGRARRTIRPECAVECRGVLCSAMALPAAVESAAGRVQSGRTWLPGLTVPGEPYRFRFRAAPSAPTLATSQSAMIAARLLPEELIEWLSTLPAAIHSLMTIASRQPSTLPAIDDITLEAAKLARGDGLAVSLCRYPTPTHWQ